MSIPIADRFKKEPKAKFVGNNSGDILWMKFEPKVYTLRLCPPWNEEAEEEGLPFRRLEQHHGFTMPDGKKVAPICLSFIFSDEKVTRRLAKVGVLTEEDFKKTDKLGCPMCKVAELLLSKTKKNVSDDESKDYQKFAPRTSWMFNIINREDNIARVWGANQKFFKAIQETIEVKPLIFDPKKGSDFKLKVEGEGLNRRYGTPIFYEEKTPLGLAKGAKLNDLDKGLEIGVKNFSTVVELVRRNHTTIVKRSGINLNQYA